MFISRHRTRAPQPFSGQHHSETSLCEVEALETNTALLGSSGPQLPGGFSREGIFTLLMVARQCRDDGGLFKERGRARGRSTSLPEEESRVS